MKPTCSVIGNALKGLRHDVRVLAAVVLAALVLPTAELQSQSILVMDSLLESSLSAGPSSEAPVALGPLSSDPRFLDGLGGGLENLSLRADSPSLEIAENRAYIPLFFHLSGFYTGTNAVTVRARFVEGTATPGVDFDDSQPVRVFEASTVSTAGLAWIPLPLISDEIDEGTETAVFELTLDGGSQPPVRVEVDLLDDMQAGEVGFVSPRFQVNEGSTNGYAQVRLWRTLDTRRAATVDLLLEGSTNDLAVLGVPTRLPVTFQPGESQIFVQIPLVDDREAQGVRNLTLRIDPTVGNVRVMRDLGSTVLTVADDETPGIVSPITITEFEGEDGRRGVMVSTTVPRGYKVRLEYSENGVEGPWQVAWVIEGADTERFVFDSYETSAMRMYRLLPPEPLDLTFPW